VDFRAILSALAADEVRFVLVGGVAGELQGVPIHTFDVDIVHARDAENCARLSHVLRALDARYRQHKTKRLEPQEKDLALLGHHLLLTAHGPLDVLGSVAGGRTYEDLVPHSVWLELGDGLRVAVLELETLIEIKEAAGRAKDRATLPEYRATLAERRKLGR